MMYSNRTRETVGGTKMHIFTSLDTLTRNHSDGELRKALDSAREAITPV